MFKKTSVVVSALVLSLSTMNVHANQDLARTNNCMACHAVDKKLVGPSFKDIAARYKSRSDAVQYLTSKIQKGGSGAWGPIPMPAQPHVNEDSAKKLSEWIRAL